MNRNALVALAILLLVFGGGYLAFALLFTSSGQGTEPQSAGADAQPKTTTAAAPATIFAIYAEEVVGLVERRNKDASWSPISAGDGLEMTDEIRTDSGAKATFKIGEDTSIVVAQETSLGFVEISEAVSKIRLSDGLVAASTSGRKVHIEVKNSDAVAETSDGSFSVLTEGQGHVAVASERGSVNLSAKGETVEVTAGMQSHVSLGAAPAAPTPIPSSLYLKVKRPRAGELLQSALVEGSASPGTIINIGETRVPVGSEGAFKKRVDLDVGSRDIRVTVVDAAGRRETQSVRVIAPKANTKGIVEW